MHVYIYTNIRTYVYAHTYIWNHPVIFNFRGRKETPIIIISMSLVTVRAKMIPNIYGFSPIFLKILEEDSLIYHAYISNNSTVKKPFYY